MSFVNFDLEKYPVVYITFNSAPRDSEDMETYLAQFEGLLIAAQSAHSPPHKQIVEPAGLSCDDDGDDCRDSKRRCDGDGVDGGVDGDGNDDDDDGGDGVITFIIDLGELGIADNINMMLYLPTKINFIHKIHNVGLENVIAKTIIIVRNSIARSVLNSALSNITLRKPYATAATKEEATNIAIHGTTGSHGE